MKWLIHGFPKGAALFNNQATVGNVLVHAEKVWTLSTPADIHSPKSQAVETPLARMS